MDESELKLRDKLTDKREEAQDIRDKYYFKTHNSLLLVSATTLIISVSFGNPLEFSGHIPYNIPFRGILNYLPLLLNILSILANAACMIILEARGRRVVAALDKLIIQLFLREISPKDDLFADAGLTDVYIFFGRASYISFLLFIISLAATGFIN